MLDDPFDDDDFRKPRRMTALDLELAAGCREVEARMLRKPPGVPVVARGMPRAADEGEEPEGGKAGAS
jgi:hypothetical protein